MIKPVPVSPPCNFDMGHCTPYLTLPTNPIYSQPDSLKHPMVHLRYNLASTWFQVPALYLSGYFHLSFHHRLMSHQPDLSHLSQPPGLTHIRNMLCVAIFGIAASSIWKKVQIVGEHQNYVSATIVIKGCISWATSGLKRRPGGFSASTFSLTPGSGKNTSLPTVSDQQRL